ncbi:MAG: type II secretion system protein [Candidatus Portnoybacteria bacterium]|nr:type II secretion system protein [Candidatus Portnoybacteria bacterium]
MNYKQKGFTLIELLVVIAIIALLAVLVLFSIENIRAKSRDTRRVTDIKSVQEGLAMYHNDYQLYPVADGYITGSDAVSNALVADGVMRAVPIDPLNKTMKGVIYKYYYQSVQGKTYLIEYYLETDSVQGKSQGLNTAVP